MLRVILSTIALASGQLKLGALLIELDTFQIDELLEDRTGWSQVYKP